eukprot:6675766-Lingulodinium_polyedra.AAC.1
MGWRCTWPGMLAQFCSASTADKQAALQDLRTDWEAFLEAEEVARKDTFIMKLVCNHTFSIALVRELGE